jgi:hypothetical protein
MVGFLDSPRERVWVAARAEPMDEAEIAHLHRLLDDLRVTPGGNDPPESIAGASIMGIDTSQGGLPVIEDIALGRQNVGPPRSPP